MATRKILIFAFLIFLVWSSNSISQRISGTNTNYDEGDWISYTQSRHVHSLQVTPDVVYAATEGGILRYNLHSGKWLFPFTVSNGLPENMILAVAYNVASNLLWCSTPSALALYDRTSRIWQNSYLDELGLDPDDPILSIGFSGQNVWLESQSGRSYSGPLQIMIFNEGQPEEYESIVWYGRRGFVPAELRHYYMENSMFFVPDASDYFVQDENLRSFRFSYYANDPWQTLWLGSSGLGIFSADNRTGNMVQRPFGLLSQDVRAIHKKDSEIWLAGIPQGGELEGITLWQRRKKSWLYFEPTLISRFHGREVFAICDAGGSVWFATNDGLVRYRRKDDRWRTYTTYDYLRDNRIYALAGDESSLWVGSHDGLDLITRFHEKADSVTVTHITDRRDEVGVYDLLLDDRVVWAATSHGLFFYDLMNTKSGFNRGANGPGAEQTTAVARYGDSLWVSTPGTVYVYNLSKRVWGGTPARRNFGVYVNDLAATDNSIWVGTDDGLFKYNMAEKRWREFTIQDGLLDPIVQKIVPDGDYILIGSPKGLTRFFWNSPYRID